MFKGHISTGTVTGTGSAINVEVGFEPKVVVIINETDPGLYVWTDTMANAEMLKVTDAVAMTFPTSNGVSAYAGSVATNSTGFTIGADSDMNASSDVIHYIALGAE
ncbi:hypothetical protein [Roseovarius sp.]|uniref:hypothetical protein n=1 Tax=Roseovarius sp. TaxID=1486281 RepID=UPI003BAC4EE2